MPHPPRHAGQLPAPPAAPCPAGTGGQQSGTAASGPWIGEPLSVWPATPAPGPAPGSGPEAAHVITAFSRPGELVVIPAAGTGALLSAAAAAGRRVLGLFPGPAAGHAASSRLDWDFDPARRPLAQARAVGPDLLLEAGCPEAGQAALAITGRGGPGAGGVLYAACERVLRPGGVLAIITASTPRLAGLVYVQHIVALHAAITDGRLTPGPPGAARPDEAAGPPAVHARIHSDLLVLTKPGTAAGSAGLKGFQPEPEGPVRWLPSAHPWVPGLDDGWISRGRARRMAGIFSRAATALVNMIGCWLPCSISCPLPREAAHGAGGHGDLPSDSHRAGALAVTGVSIRWACV